MENEQTLLAEAIFDELEDNDIEFLQNVKDIINTNIDECATASLPLPVKQLVERIERNKKLLQENIELVENNHCPEVLRNYLLKHQMPEIKARLEHYQFGLQMAIYGFNIGKSTVDDEEKQLLDKLIASMIS